MSARRLLLLLIVAALPLAAQPADTGTVRFDVVEVALGVEGAGDAAAGPPLLHFENVPLFPRHFRGA